MKKSYVKLTIEQYNSLVISQSDKGEIDKLKEDINRLQEILYAMEKAIKSLYEEF